MRFPLVIIGGPTASGKSALALELAQEISGIIINADSMQLYADLAILTGRPRVEALLRVGHRLYGEYALPQVCCVERWRRRVLSEIQTCRAQGKTPLIVGGTGFYLRSLRDGLSPLPQIPEEIRRMARRQIDAMGLAAVYARLCQKDPLARRLHPQDRQRITRAWEVFQATGVSLFEWQTRGAGEPLGRVAICWAVLWPEKEELYQACNARFIRMLESGAIEEVERLGSGGDHPLYKAIGVALIQRYLRGQISYDQAVIDGQQAVRHYAKRQRTWWRHQLNPATEDVVDTFTAESRRQVIETIRRRLDTVSKAE